MKRLINFLKRFFGYKEVCPKCKSNPCKCELEMPVEHICTVEPAPAKEEIPICEFPITAIEAELATDPEIKLPEIVEDKVASVNTEEVKTAAPKKKRAPRKKKVDTEKK